MSSRKRELLSFKEYLFKSFRKKPKEALLFLDEALSASVSEKDRKVFTRAVHKVALAFGVGKEEVKKRAKGS